MKRQERIDRIELMRTYIRIVEAGSLSAAAGQMDTTQATVSRRLQSLEGLLGVKLILRTTHAMKLTDDGERCYRHARQVVDAWLALEDDLRIADDRPVGVLRVRAPHAFGQQQLLAPLVSTDSLYVARNTALAGLGVAMVSSWTVVEDIAAGRLIELFPQWRPASLPVHLVYPWARYYPTRLRKFLDLMREIMPDLAGMQPPQSA